MRIIEDVFRMERNECKDQETLTICRKNPCQSKEDALAWDRQLRLGQWQWTSRGLWQPRETQRGRRRSRKTNETPQGTWLKEDRRGNLWLSYAGPMAGKQTSGISGSWQRPKPTPWERNSWGNKEKRKKRMKSRGQNKEENTQI